MKTNSTLERIVERDIVSLNVGTFWKRGHFQITAKGCLPNNDVIYLNSVFVCLKYTHE